MLTHACSPALLVFLACAWLQGSRLSAQELVLNGPAEERPTAQGEELSLREPTDAPGVLLDGHTSAAEQIQQRFPNGNVQIERWVVQSQQGDWINHGPYIEYNVQGEQIVEGRFEYGRQVGEWTQQITLEQAEQLTQLPPSGFHPPLLSKATFVAGQLHGDWSCADSQGNLLFVWKFEEGQRQGQSLVFDIRGEPIQSLHYEDNLVHGPAKVREAGDRRLREVEFDQGRLLKLVERYFPSETAGERRLQSQIGYLLPTTLNVESHDWRGSRVTYMASHTQTPIQHGPAITYFSNGNPAIEGHFVYGKRHGRFLWWYANGQQRAEGQYAQDQQQGEWTWWHRNGMKEATSNYTGGLQIARSVWAEDGKLVNRTRAPESPQASPKVPMRTVAAGTEVKVTR